MPTLQPQTVPVAHCTAALPSAGGHLISLRQKEHRITIHYSCKDNFMAAQSQLQQYIISPAED